MQEFLQHLSRLSRCLDKTRQEICEALAKQEILTLEDYAEISTLCKRMDAFAKNKEQQQNK